MTPIDTINDIARDMASGNNGPLSETVNGWAKRLRRLAREMEDNPPVNVGSILEAITVVKDHVTSSIGREEPPLRSTLALWSEILGYADSTLRGAKTGAAPTSMPIVRIIINKNASTILETASCRDARPPTPPPMPIVGPCADLLAAMGGAKTAGDLDDILDATTAHRSAMPVGDRVLVLDRYLILRARLERGDGK